MPDAAHTLDLKPPRTGRWGTPLLLALIAHALLIAALTWGVHWTADEELPVSFEAELWPALPREAASRAASAPPPEPAPKPIVKTTPPPPQPEVKAADIATEKARKQRQEDEKNQTLKDKIDKEKALAAQQKALEDKKLSHKKNPDLARKAAEDRKAEADMEAVREENLRRIVGQAGASGGPEARGTAQQSSGPSSGYGARVIARIRPNIRATENFPRSLETEIEVRTAADGTIIGRRVVASSGNTAWDDAALRAIDRTGSLPRDVDGRVPSTLIVAVRPTE